MYKVLPILLVIFLGVGIFVFLTKKTEEMPQEVIDPNEIRYVALGDSYTKGDGAAVGESWAVLLTKHLQNEGIKIQLVANPSQTGWTTEEVIDYELPLFEDAQPTFATLLIGTNDWAIGMDENKFRKNLSFILDSMQKALPNKTNIVVLTNPDYSFTPLGESYSDGRDIAKGIQRFNAIIKEEAKRRNLAVVDLFPLSQRLKDNPEYISIDGLHPSAKGYRAWEEAIYPIAYEVLQKNQN